MQGENIRKREDLKLHVNENGPLNSQMSRNKRKEEIFSFHPPLVAPVSEVAEEKYFCPLLIWGWLRKGGMSKGGERGEEEREEWRDRRPEGGLLEYPLYL